MVNMTTPSDMPSSDTELQSLSPDRQYRSETQSSLDLDGDMDSHDEESQNLARSPLEPNKFDIQALHPSSGWHYLLPELLNLIFAALFWGK
jgi:hypothetical protein